jgi:hypothetical protein
MIAIFVRNPVIPVQQVGSTDNPIQGTSHLDIAFLLFWTLLPPLPLCLPAQHQVQLSQGHQHA